MAEAGEKDVIYSSKSARSGAFLRLPHGETGTGNADHAVYHELGDEIWLERKLAKPPRPPAKSVAPRRD